MYWCKALLLSLLAGNALAAEGWIVGFGGEGDSADSLAGTVIAEVGVAKSTWLSGSIGGNQVDLPSGRSLDTRYGNLGIDHWFEPVGVRLGIAYWGDSDILDSRDGYGSLYWRSERVMLAGDFEYRDFRFTIPAAGNFQGREFEFDANGIGLTARFDLTDTLSLSLSGIDYDYSVNLRVDDDRGILDLLSVSRLSLINSLVDYRASATVGLDVGERRLQFEAGAWRGAVDGSTTSSATLRFLTPLGRGSDIELGVGVDDSERYGSVTFFSVFLYFYGD